jgi:alpha-1,2-mannosyltransferase
VVLPRRFREGAVATATVAATVTIGLLALPDASRRCWTRMVCDPDRGGRQENAANQSVRGLIVRITHTREPDRAWLVLIALVALGGLACSVFAYRRLGDRWGLPACATAGLLMAPIAWSHHWVWCVPTAVLLWVDARRMLASLLVFWSFAVWWVPHVAPAELHFMWWQTALSAWYIVFGVAFLGYAAWLAGRTEARPGDYIEPSREARKVSASSTTSIGSRAKPFSAHINMASLTTPMTADAAYRGSGSSGRRPVRSAKTSAIIRRVSRWW